MGLKEEKLLRDNWGTLSLEDLANSLSIDLYSLLEFAYNLDLYSVNTPDIGRRWTKQEDKFLKDYEGKLSMQGASNLLYRSRYATYQRAKLLHLDKMINKKSTNR